VFTEDQEGNPLPFNTPVELLRDRKAMRLRCDQRKAEVLRLRDELMKA
jgi:hypothetical protein